MARSPTTGSRCCTRRTRLHARLSPPRRRRRGQRGAAARAVRRRGRAPSRGWRAGASAVRATTNARGPTRPPRPPTRAARMAQVNPWVIARNHRVEEALAAASADEDLGPSIACSRQSRGPRRRPPSTRATPSRRRPKSRPATRPSAARERAPDANRRPRLSRLLAIDWGSTAMRGALLDESAAVLDERACSRGLLNLGSGGFEAALREEFGDWLARARRALPDGRHGRQPARLGRGALRRLPGGARRLRRAVAARPVRLGVGGAARSRSFRARAAITTAFPTCCAAKRSSSSARSTCSASTRRTMLSPGTHSKWATIENRRLVGFTTAMSGEFYALLRQHSILARSLPAEDGDLDGAAFDDGVRRALEGARPAADRVQRAQPRPVRAHAALQRSPSYLSGLVVGEAVRWPGLADVATVVVIGAPVLTERFARALGAARHRQPHPRRDGRVARPVGDRSRARRAGAKRIAHERAQRSRFPRGPCRAAAGRDPARPCAGTGRCHRRCAGRRRLAADRDPAQFARSVAEHRPDGGALSAGAGRCRHGAARRRRARRSRRRRPPDRRAELRCRRRPRRARARHDRAARA